MNKTAQNKSFFCGSLAKFFGFTARLVSIMTLTTLSSSALAFYGNQNESDDVSLLEIYREKKYKGALDEEDLKVLVLQPKVKASANRSENNALEEADEGF